MLKLVKLYSNKEGIFPTIHFHNGLNIVYANEDKDNRNKTSHSLGKSTLADVIDYMLIGSKLSFFEGKKFIDFIFFLEVQTDDNLFITIQRAVIGKVSLYTSPNSINLLTDEKPSAIGMNLGIDRAKDMLNQNLKLDVIKDSLGDYRTSLRYCIRKQDEYTKIFQVKDYLTRHRNWKPYLSGLLGISADLITGKYNAIEKIKSLKIAIKELEFLGKNRQSTGELEASINNLKNKTAEMESELNSISFQKVDENITHELVDNVGSKISDINQQIYVCERKISNINDSLEDEFDYDISDIQEIFKSIEIALPEYLIKTYDELVELNKNMGKDREKHLLNAKTTLKQKLNSLINDKEELSAKQEELSQLLLDKEAFRKFQNLQKILIRDKSHLATLEERLERLNDTMSLKEELVYAKRDNGEIGLEIEKLCKQSENNTLQSINEIFSKLVKSSIGIDASFYAQVNAQKNIEFDIAVHDDTAVNKGYSYTKALALCFDVALMVFYSKQQYSRFSYHDGALESLDDRVKLRLINSLRELSIENKLQFIITVLHSDIPEDSNNQKVYFTQEEIIRELHDKGNDGRLFKMDKF